MKVPLKMKIFMWFVNKKEIPRKDNLVKRNWHGNSKCCFCDQEETIQHHFIECPFAKITWNIIHMPFTITSILNINNPFENWLNGMTKTEKVNIRVGIYAILWAILSLTNQIFHHSCRLSLWLSTRFARGPIFSRHSSV
jgi:hypothetical protein